jgi:hypothetical protein
MVECLKAKDEIISFNYDCLIDETLKRVGAIHGLRDMGMGLTCH